MALGMETVGLLQLRDMDCFPAQYHESICPSLFQGQMPLRGVKDCQESPYGTVSSYLAKLFALKSMLISRLWQKLCVHGTLDLYPLSI